MAVALLLPAVVTTLSSAISPSGVVIDRDVNPLPAAPLSRGHHVRSKDQLVRTGRRRRAAVRLALLPLAPAVTSSVVTPRYSRIRTSGYDCRLVERHRHRVAATHYVARRSRSIVAMPSRSSARSPDYRCSLRCPSPTAPSTWCRSTPPPQRSDPRTFVLPDSSRSPSPSLVCGVADATWMKLIVPGAV